MPYGEKSGVEEEKLRQLLEIRKDKKKKYLQRFTLYGRAVKAQLYSAHLKTERNSTELQNGNAETVVRVTGNLVYLSPIPSWNILSQPSHRLTNQHPWSLWWNQQVASATPPKKAKGKKEEVMVLMVTDATTEISMDAAEAKDLSQVKVIFTL